MASTIANFFQKHLAAQADDVDDHVKGRRARLAAAALLVEVVHADGHIVASERTALLTGIRKDFNLTDMEAVELLASAEAQAREAVDLHQFTTLINSQFSADEKLDLITALWRAALADEVLHRHEEYLVRKIADLLHVSNTSALAAKHRAQAPNRP
ncbi:MAG TPA: TerB family tellurite resistance protein [Steroidobacteraceae bacterium]|nr:TerB family tellurite resistance protein [Steroidobacteraceae bacterium]